MAAMASVSTTISKIFAKNDDNSPGKLTFKDSALNRDKLSRSCRRVFSHATLTRDL